MSDLDISYKDINVQINIFKAEEIIRAKLAQANYNSYKNEWEVCPSRRGSFGSAGLEVISNVNRDLQPGQNFTSTPMLSRGDSVRGLQLRLNYEDPHLECERIRQAREA